MSLANLMKRGSLRQLATATSATPATDGAKAPGTVATVAKVAVATAQNDPVQLTSDRALLPADLDRWAWPNGTAMNGAEVDRTIERISVFMRRGLHDETAAHLADKLVVRDREGDERHACMECAHLRGRNCVRSAAAGMTANVEQIVLLLQRCPSFQPVNGP